MWRWLTSTKDCPPKEGAPTLPRREPCMSRVASSAAPYGEVTASLSSRDSASAKAPASATEAVEGSCSSVSPPSADSCRLRNGFDSSRRESRALGRFEDDGCTGGGSCACSSPSGAASSSTASSISAIVGKSTTSTGGGDVASSEQSGLGIAACNLERNDADEKLTSADESPVAIEVSASTACTVTNSVSSTSWHGEASASGRPTAPASCSSYPSKRFVPSSGVIHLSTVRSTVLELKRTLRPVPGVFGSLRIPFEPFRLSVCSAASTEGESKSTKGAVESFERAGGVASRTGGGGGGGRVGAARRGEGQRPRGENWTRSIGPLAVEARILVDVDVEEEAVSAEEERENDAREGVRVVVGGESGIRRMPLVWPTEEAFARTGVPATGACSPAVLTLAANEGEATGEGPSEPDEWSPKLSDGNSAESRWNDASELLLLPPCRTPGESLNRVRGTGERFGGVARVSTRSPSTPRRSCALKLREWSNLDPAEGESSSPPLESCCSCRRAS